MSIVRITGFCVGMGALGMIPVAHAEDMGTQQAPAMQGAPMDYSQMPPTGPYAGDMNTLQAPPPPPGPYQSMMMPMPDEEAAMSGGKEAMQPGAPMGYPPGMQSPMSGAAGPGNPSMQYGPGYAGQAPNNLQEMQGPPPGYPGMAQPPSAQQYEQEAPTYTGQAPYYPQGMQSPPPGSSGMMQESPYPQQDQAPQDQAQTEEQAQPPQSPVPAYRGQAYGYPYGYGPPEQGYQQPYAYPGMQQAPYYGPGRQTYPYAEPQAYPPVYNPYYNRAPGNYPGGMPQGQ